MKNGKRYEGEKERGGRGRVGRRPITETIETVRGVELGGDSKQYKIKLPNQPYLCKVRESI